jgi:hypothetical protein
VPGAQALAEPHARAEPRAQAEPCVRPEPRARAELHVEAERYVEAQGCWEPAAPEQDAFPDAALALAVEDAVPLVYVVGPADAVPAAARDEPQAEVPVVPQGAAPGEPLAEPRIVPQGAVRCAELPLPAGPVLRRVPAAPRWDALPPVRLVAPQEGCAVKAPPPDALRDRPPGAWQPPGSSGGHD